MDKYFYAILILFLSQFISNAQAMLEGKVTNGFNKENIFCATVQLLKSDSVLYVVETDREGYYRIVGINPGEYTIRTTYLGYHPHETRRYTIDNDRANRLDIELKGIKNIVDVENSFDSEETAYISDKSTHNSSPATSMISPKIKGEYADDDGRESSILGLRSIGNLGWASSESGSAKSERPLPASGQMTVGEWNDLHNWKDWLSLLEDENYGIMMERFSIFPTERYSVLALNDKNSVMVNIPVQLLDGAGKVLWESYTDNAGKAELWANVFEKDQNPSEIRIAGQSRRDLVKVSEGSNNFVVKSNCFSPTQVDIVFTVDATSSMNDEINYLKSELLDVIDRIQETNDEINFRLGSVFYRDTRDEYLTRVSPFSSDISQTIEFVKQQNSNGGGDHPEAVDAALERTLGMEWRKDALKLVFLLLDAPSHEDEVTMSQIRQQIKTAAEKGIKLIPVTASGIGRETEFLMKFMALLTNGTYVFITDHSGIGNPHLDPVVKDYEVEKLNDCLVRLISQYSKSYSCDSEEHIEAIQFSVYPNPTTQYITIETQSIADKIKIFSSNGMVMKVITPTSTTTRIEMDDLVNGIYMVSILKGKEMTSKQIILLR